MQVLLINPKKSKRSRDMAKKKGTRRTKKTTAVAKVTVKNPKRKARRVRRRVRRNPSKSFINSLLFYGIGGFAGIEAPKYINRFVPVRLPLGITVGDIGTMGAGYMLMKSRKSTVKEIGTAMFATSAGLTLAKIVGSVSKGGLKGLEGMDLSGLEAGEYLIDFDGQAIMPLEALNEEDVEENELQKFAI